ncbi:uncharacterized protein LOC130644495 isoform X2 [Hydractinia symbiolongicarpus]|uniref:uncharacterized protein LOC130644495 isoform X2 n=1 Tax=Hydractinia symbiolongicarpus TaxID=13093 RepID=UPI00254FCEAD|nr:uncharacterized protein LOC130644495 isoform X2 [Hydractinia symbiolongicarpus]
MLSTTNFEVSKKSVFVTNRSFHRMKNHSDYMGTRKKRSYCKNDDSLIQKKNKNYKELAVYVIQSDFKLTKPDNKQYKRKRSNVDLQHVRFPEDLEESFYQGLIDKKARDDHVVPDYMMPMYSCLDDDHENPLPTLFPEERNNKGKSGNKSFLRKINHAESTNVTRSSKPNILQTPNLRCIDEKRTKLVAETPLLSKFVSGQIHRISSGFLVPETPFYAINTTTPGLRTVVEETPLISHGSKFK